MMFVWNQLKPPVKKKDLETLMSKQGTCFMKKFIVSYEPGAKIGRLIPNGFASCLHHEGMAAILEDGFITEPTVLDRTIITELERLYQPYQLIAREGFIKIQEYIAGLYESREEDIEWITLKELLNRYSGYIRNAERLPVPQRLEHTIYRKMKETLETWDSIMNQPF